MDRATLRQDPVISYDTDRLHAIVNISEISKPSAHTPSNVSPPKDVELERLARRQEELQAELSGISQKIEELRIERPAAGLPEFYGFGKNSECTPLKANYSVTPIPQVQSTSVSNPQDRYVVPPSALEYTSSQAYENLPHLLNLVMGLPKKEIPCFSGDPGDYWRFYRAFTHGVAQYTNDPANRLSYLINYCEGKARKSIEHCTILEPQEGYKEAWRILERCYGQPHIVASKLISDLTDGPRIRPDDDAGLLALAESMEAIEITLKQLRADAELNTRIVMSAVVARLPDAFQFRWFDVASSSLRSTYVPRFSDLNRFIRERADAVSTRRMYTNKPSASYIDPRQMNKGHKTTINERNADKGHFTLTTASTNPSYRPVCLKCQGKHYLDECAEFLSLCPTDRKTYVEMSLLCKLCLKPKHDVSQCKSRKLCGFEGCTMQHHPLLHSCFKSNVILSADTSHHASNANINTGIARLTEPIVALGVVPVLLQGPAGEVVVNALLDSGSDATLVSQGVMQKIGLTGEKKMLSLTTLHGERHTEAFRVAISLRTAVSETPHTINAWAVQNLPKVTPLIPTRRQIQRWKHLQGIEWPPVTKEPIELLIGMDIPALHWVIESKFGESSDPYAIRTQLGWVILGPVATKKSTVVISNNVLLKENYFMTKFQAAFEEEFSEVVSANKGHSRDDILAVDTVRRGLQLIDGHYQIPLPWKLRCPNLLSNKGIAVKRLQQLSNRLSKDVHLWELYKCAMNEYLECGYAELAPNLPTDGQFSDVWYLPHHPVFHPQKPNKVRVVFDCACSFQEYCLNKQLLSGPDIGNGLFGVLLRFRQSPYVFAADIEAMFHQVKVPPEQRCYLRFLWWKGGDMSLEPTEFQMTAHPFGATSSPFCASFALRETLENNRVIFDSKDPTEAIRSFYVDDCLYSTDSAKKLVRFAHQLKTALLNGGFNLTKWSSNAHELLRTISVDEQASNLMNLDLQPIAVKRMLGVEWDMINDVFRFRMVPSTERPTRRRMLSYVASVYDPLGLVSPVVLPGRLLLQEITREKIGWDETLDDQRETQWRKFLLGLSFIDNVTIPRCIRPTTTESQKLQFHCFSDASANAYGVAIYLRSTSSSGVVHCSLVCAKSRVAPLKSVTIPRLELTAAVLAVRLGIQVKEQCTLSVESLTFWTDSMIVLQMIRNRSTRFPVFVANRLSVILDHSTPDNWRYISGSQNPADLASRGVAATKLKNTQWFTGPEFLSLDVDQWPDDKTDTDFITEVQGVTVSACVSQPNWFERFSRCRTWNSLIRTVAWLRKFCAYLRNRSANINNMERFLTVNDTNEATLRIIRCVQVSVFSNELQILLESPNNNKRALLSAVSPLRKLNPFLDHGVLRVGGRLRWAFLPFETKHPAILPRKHFVTRLIIEYHHMRAGHVGASQVLAAIREKFWVLQGSAAVRSVIASCYYCRRWFSRPCQQVMAPLPIERTEALGRPFAFTGVDYFGPLLVRKGRGTEKRYGCLFTCLSIRAVHIEVTQSLDTDSFLCAFFRFAARRGNPLKLFSDNGTNFRGAELEVRRCLHAWDQERLRKKLSEHDCDWKFSTPKASHQGGVWERQIRTVRRILRGLLGERLVDDQTLQTALTEVEKIINDRPIVKLTSDPNDFTALTPSHLLLLRGNQAVVPQEFSPHVLSKRWMKAQHLADLFWSRWRREYLPNLISCDKWLKRGMNLGVGDLVLLADETLHRGMWKKGVVIEVVKSADNAVRQVRVKTSQGTRLRDVRHLCLLESHGERINQTSDITLLAAEAKDGQLTKPGMPQSSGEC